MQEERASHVVPKKRKKLRIRKDLTGTEIGGEKRKQTTRTETDLDIEVLRKRKIRT